jgi:hypothetical protein
LTPISRAKNKQNLSLGIPEISRRIAYEKITETLPVKLWPSLARYVREHGGSQLMRQAILSYLEEKESAGSL